MLPYPLNPFGISKTKYEDNSALLILELQDDFYPSDVMVSIQPYNQSGTGYIIVNWGDGTNSTIEHNTSVEHNYKKGKYKITIVGSVDNLYLRFSGTLPSSWGGAIDKLYVEWFSLNRVTGSGTFEFSSSNFTEIKIDESLWTSGKYNIDQPEFSFSDCQNIVNYDDIPAAWK